LIASPRERGEVGEAQCAEPGEGIALPIRRAVRNRPSPAPPSSWA